jgi:hypothetical protein
MKLIAAIAGLVVVVVAVIVVVLVASGGSGDSDDGAAGGDGRLLVPVDLHGAERVGGLQLTLRYDDADLEFNSVAAGPLAQGALVESDGSTAGTVTIVLVHASGISGDGSLVDISFQIRDGFAAPSELMLEQVEISDTDLRDLVFEAVSGAIDGSPLAVSAPSIDLR